MGIKTTKPDFELREPEESLLAGKAREFGIGELLLTCEADNPASVRLCDSLPDARHESAEAVVDGRRCRIRRTWIDLTGKPGKTAF